MSHKDNDRALAIGFALARQHMQSELDLVRDQIAADWASLRQELAETRAELDPARRSDGAARQNRLLSAR